MRQIALAKLLLVDMAIDIDCLFSHIVHKLMYEFARHSGTKQAVYEPMAAAVRKEVVLH
jgi:hypothetical protein